MQVSELQINDESVNLIVLSLATECHHFALESGIASHSIVDQLPLVFSILDSHSGHILDIRDVSTVGTTCRAGITIRFSDEGYRFLADAAKDRIANPVN